MTRPKQQRVLAYRCAAAASLVAGVSVLLSLVVSLHTTRRIAPVRVEVPRSLMLALLVVASLFGLALVMLDRAGPALVAVAQRTPTVREDSARAVYSFPFRYTLAAIGVGLIVIGAAFALNVTARQIPPAIALGRLAADLVVTAMGALSGYALLRRIVRPILDELPAPRFEPRFALGVAGKLLVAVSVPGLSLVVVLMSLSAQWLRDRPAPMAAVALGSTLWWVAAAGSALICGVGLAVGLIVRRDLREGAAAVERLAVRPVAGAAAGCVEPLRPSCTREAAGLLAAISDVARWFDEMRMTQERAIESGQQGQRIKTQFLASMSHDLRSPLNSISGFSELLLRGVEGPLNDAQRESVQQIHRSGEDLLQLINDILDAAKIEVGQMDLHKTWTLTVEVLNESIRRGRMLLGNKPIDLVAEIQPGLPPIRMDGERVMQSICALLANAVRFVERGQIRVRASLASATDLGASGRRFLRVDIEDTGAGVRDEDREAIFDAFRRIDAPTAHRSGRIGLSLSLARSLVELHGGRLWFESLVGRGSMFHIALPVETSSEPPISTLISTPRG